MSRTDTTIELCGGLVVSVAGGRCENALPGRQGRLAVAYLALHRAQPVTREQLVTALWGEDASGEHGQALNVVLSKLRRALGPGVLENAGEGAVRLAERVTVDVDEAIEACEQARAARERGDWRAVAAAAARAVAIADRGLLPGSDASWIEEPRRRLEAEALEARELCAESGLAFGGAELASAERAAAELVRAAPFRETGYVLLMRVRAAQGNVAEALRVYDRLREVLREELGVTPGPRARAEVAALLREEERATAEPVSQRRAVFATRSDAMFVGRRRELERLRDYFGRVAAGRGQLVLLEGEPGIGKTRLALQLTLEAAQQGALGLYGRCDADSPLPYQPFVEALRQAAGDLPPERVAGWAEQHGAELGRVIPELAGSAAAPAEGDGRYRLFEAVSQIVADIAAAQPVVLVLDDLHWADKPTLLLLRQLVRFTEDVPLLIVASYRDSERPAELVDAVVQLRREHFLEQISLAGLDESDTAALIGELRDAVPGHVSRALWEETRGNPFFLEEMVRHLAGRADDNGDWPVEHDLPEGVREVISRRLASLSELTNRVLTQAAVMGREFDLAVLELTGPAREDELDDAIEEGVRAQVVAEVPGAFGRCSFTHALIRQTLYDGVLSSRRARLHQRVAEALETLHAGDTRTGELAHHFSLAPPDRGAVKAADYAERAARAASASLAYEEAARLYDLGLHAAGGREASVEQRCRLLLGRGDAQTKAGDVEAARATFLEAAAAARDAGSATALAQAALGLGTAGQMSGGVVDQSVVSLLEEALAAVGDGDPALRARLLARLAMELSFAGERERRAGISAEAVQLARRVGDPSGLGFALAARHWSLWGPHNVDERLASADELLELAAHTGDDRLALQGHRFRMIDMLELGDIEGVDAQIDAYADVARRRGRLSELLYVHLFRAMRLLLAGDLDAGHETSREAQRLGERIGGDTNARQAHVLQMLALRRERGGLDTLEETVRDCAGRFSAIPGWHCVLAYIHALTGRRDEARAALDRLAADDFGRLPLDGLWLGAVAMLSETAVSLGDPTHADALYRLLLPYAERNVALGWVSACVGSASRPLALLAGLSGDREAAIAHFESAVAMNARMGARPWLARTRLDYARLLLSPPADIDDRDHAAELLRLALDDARELDMPVLAMEASGITTLRTSERGVR